MFELLGACFRDIAISPLVLMAMCGNVGIGAAAHADQHELKKKKPVPVVASVVKASPDNAIEQPSSTPNTTATPPATASAPATVTTASVPSSVSVAYDDAEYRLSGTNTSAKALAAYSAGATGAGVKIAIIDSGLSDPKGEFAGRIDPASSDMVSGRGISDEGGHGTAVAAVAAAGRSGNDIMGIAFDAQLLIERADNVGSCVSINSCSYSNDTLARAIDHARTNGARVINLSLGGSAASKAMIQAVKTAAAAGIIVVIAAGNDGAAAPGALAQLAGQSGTNGLVVIAGSHNADYQMSSFSNRAGSYSQYYLTAMGEAVRAFDNSGTDMMFSGTSYAAPAISGAIALMLQAFPNMTAKQVLDLLYSTATDAGAPGLDAVFGQGILNLDNAFRPQGVTKVAGSMTPISVANNGTLSSAMGDATATGASATPNLIFVDGFGRAYTLDLGATLGRLRSGPSLAGNLRGSFRSSEFGNGPVRLTFNMAQGYARSNGFAADAARVGARRPSMRLISSRGTAKIDPKTQMSFGLAETGTRLSGLVDQRVELPYLVARDIDVSVGFDSADVRSLAVSRDMGLVRSTVWAETGRVAEHDLRHRTASGYRMIGLRFSGQAGRLTLSSGATFMREDGTVLGARFGRALGGAGASTQMLDLRASWLLGRGWALGGAYRQAWTSADRSGALAIGRLTSNAFSVDIGRSGDKERVGLRVAQPMRVVSSRYILVLPTSLDLKSGAVTTTRQPLNLTPKGREIDVEASYGRRLGTGWIDANLFLRREPGNVATASADRGMTLRYSARF